MRKSKTSYKSALVLMLSGVVLGILLMLIPQTLGPNEAGTQISATTLKTSLEQASELITTRYNYAKVGQFSNSLELNGWTIPFTEKNFILSYQGVASLGVNMEDADVQVEEQTIVIHLPSVALLSNTIDENSIEVYNESTNVFNPIRVSDYLQFAIQQKQVVEEQLQQEGVYELAKKDADQAIRSLLMMIPDVSEQYEIQIEFTDSSQITDQEN